MTIVQLLLTNFAVLLVGATLLWLLSLQLKNASIVDICWSILCAAPAVLTFFRYDTASPRAAIITALVSLWAVRLSGYLAKRNIGAGEDYRYVAMRKRREPHGDFARWSLIYVFWLQAAIAFVISLPVQLGQIGADKPIGILAILGVIIFFIGLAFETIGDWQLAAFKRDPANKGKLMTKGLWGLTRHPNYFGDACVWFGLSMIALEGPYRWFGIASPFIMAHFLMNISGKALLERAMAKKYPEYADYQKRVSGFFSVSAKKNDQPNKIRLFRLFRQYQISMLATLRPETFRPIQSS